MFYSSGWLTHEQMTLFRHPRKTIIVNGVEVPGYFPVDGLQRVTIMSHIAPETLIPYVEVDVEGTIQALREEFCK